MQTPLVLQKGVHNVVDVVENIVAKIGFALDISISSVKAIIDGEERAAIPHNMISEEPAVNKSHVKVLDVRFLVLL